MTPEPDSEWKKWDRVLRELGRVGSHLADLRHDEYRILVTDCMIAVRSNRDGATSSVPGGIATLFDNLDAVMDHLLDCGSKRMARRVKFCSETLKSKVL